jgi:pimeloyl-ACP methyl ester carboxylesterase
MARFVLVHGAFGGAWCWVPVVAPLEERGHTVETLDLPGGGDDATPPADVTLERCAARVREVLERGEPAVLVAHSMGGVVATQAASESSDRVAALVFVCAFMPADGQSLLDLTHLPEGQGDMIQANLQVEGDPPVATLPDDAAAAAIYNCCTPEQTSASLPRRRPQAVAPFATPVRVDESVLAAIPRFYVLTKQDNSIPPALQRRMIGEHPCTNVVELDTDHAPYLSATEELVAALDRFASTSAEGRNLHAELPVNP